VKRLISRRSREGDSRRSNARRRTKGYHFDKIFLLLLEFVEVCDSPSGASCQSQEYPPSAPPGVVCQLRKGLKTLHETAEKEIKIQSIPVHALSLFSFTLDSMSDDIHMSETHLHNDPQSAIHQLKQELVEAFQQRDSLMAQVNSMSAFRQIVGFTPYPIDSVIHDNPGGPLQTVCRKIGALDARIQYLELVENENQDLYESPTRALKREYDQIESKAHQLFEIVQLRANWYRSGVKDLQSSSSIFPWSFQMPSD